MRYILQFRRLKHRGGFQRTGRLKCVFLFLSAVRPLKGRMFRFRPTAKPFVGLKGYGTVIGSPRCGHSEVVAGSSPISFLDLETLEISSDITCSNFSSPCVVVAVSEMNLWPRIFPN